MVDVLLTLCEVCKASLLLSGWKWTYFGKMCRMTLILMQSFGQSDEVQSFLLPVEKSIRFYDFYKAFSLFLSGFMKFYQFDYISFLEKILVFFYQFRIFIRLN